MNFVDLPHILLQIFYCTCKLIVVQGWTTSMGTYSLSKNTPLSVLHFHQHEEYRRIRKPTRYAFRNTNTALSVLTRVDNIIAQQEQQVEQQYTSDTTTTTEYCTSREGLIVDTWDNNVVDEHEEVNEDNDMDDEYYYEQPKSMFGTKEYWDTTYMGHGDFPSDEYTWYYGWDDISIILNQYNINVFSKTTEQQEQQQQSRSDNNMNNKILIPGIGNDRILLDMIQQLQKDVVKNPTITQKTIPKTIIVAQDYSIHAIDRQCEMLDYNGNTFTVLDDKNNVHNSSNDCKNSQYQNNNNNIQSNNKYEIQLIVNNVRKLPKSWYGSYDYIIEKGLLDAVYLSSDDNEAIIDAVTNLAKCLKPNGILISISGVVPNELRNTILFPVATDTVTAATGIDTTTTPIMKDNSTCIESTINNIDDDISTTKATTWTWLRDGTNDLRAGCFILQKS